MSDALAIPASDPEAKGLSSLLRMCPAKPGGPSVPPSPLPNPLDPGLLPKILHRLMDRPVGPDLNDLLAAAPGVRHEFLGVVGSDERVA